MKCPHCKTGFGRIQLEAVEIDSATLFGPMPRIAACICGRCKEFLGFVAFPESTKAGRS